MMDGRANRDSEGCGLAQGAPVMEEPNISGKTN